MVVLQPGLRCRNKARSQWLHFKNFRTSKDPVYMTRVAVVRVDGAKVREEMWKNNGDGVPLRVVNVNQGSGGLAVVASAKFCTDLEGSGGKCEWVERPEEVWASHDG